MRAAVGQASAWSLPALRPRATAQRWADAPPAPRFVHCPRVLAPSERPSEVSTSAQSDLAAEASGEFCMPAYVTVDNQKNERFTILDVEVQDYPGLVRVIAWTLNGLDMIAQNAVLRTSAEGTAQNTFWLTTRSGKKLSNESADALAERVRDFVMYCSPSADAAGATEFSAGPISVSNSANEQYTVVTVREESPTPGFLLEVASVLTGLNVEILQGVIQGCTDCGEEVPKLTTHIPGGRLFQFWVRDKDGQKLEYGDVSTLMYALNIGLGFRAFPLSPPNLILAGNQ